MSVHYENIDEIEAVARGFEDCSTARDDFTHASHLTVAFWFLHNHGFEQAAVRMRAGLVRFLDHHEVSREKYNETITLFWLKGVNAFAAGQSATKGPVLPGVEIVSLTNELIRTFGDAGLIFDYYSENLLRSPEARNAWLEPDLKQLNFLA